MPPPRERHGRPRPSAEQLTDHSTGHDAPQIGAPGWPSRTQNIGGDSASGPSRGHSFPVASRVRAIPVASRGRAIPGPSRGRPRSPPCRDHVAEPPSAQTLQQPGSPILVRDPPDWYFKFYIRTDLLGSFHTYPDLGGPFQSLREADNVIDRHLHHLQHPKMCKDSLDKLSRMESAILQSLYWPDGTTKKQSEPPAIDKSHDPMRQLVQALVDQYNEDHNLLGDLAYELKDVLHHRFFFSESDRYYHFNFTTETKGVDGFDCGIDNLFFAEVKFMQGEQKEMVVTCFCIIKPNDNGHCYGCRSNGRVDMKHPNKADAYSGGHVNGYLPCGGLYIERSVFGEDLEAKEKRLRRIYEGLDDPRFLEKTFPNCFPPAGKAKKHAGVED